MSKKVLFILRLPPPFGGGEIVSQLLFENIKDQSNYYFHIVKRRSHSKSKQANFSIISAYYGLIYLLKVIYSILRVNPDIIYLGLPKSFLAFFRNSIVIHFAYLINKNVYAELHGMEFPFLNNKAKKYFYKKTIVKISKLRVLSNSIREYIFATGYNGKTFVIDNAIEIPKNIVSKVRGDFSQPLSLLYLGAISSMKGFHECLQLLRSYNERNKFIKLNVIGEWVNNYFRDECLNYISKYKLTDIITLHGLIIDDHKWKYIDENDFIVYLSKFDGQPLAIIESLALGIPAFSKKVGGIGEMIKHEHNGFIIESWEEISNYIDGFLSLKYNYAEISKNAKETYKTRFTPDIMTKNVIAMIKN